MQEEQSIVSNRLKLNYTIVQATTRRIVLLLNPFNVNFYIDEINNSSHLIYSVIKYDFLKIFILNKRIFLVTLNFNVP
jgi:hypothetical protein